MTFELYSRVLQLIDENSQKKGKDKELLETIFVLEDFCVAFLFDFPTFLFPLSRFLKEYLMFLIPCKSANNERY